MFGPQPLRPPEVAFLPPRPLPRWAVIGVVVGVVLAAAFLLTPPYARAAVLSTDPSPLTASTDGTTLTVSDFDVTLSGGTFYGSSPDTTAAVRSFVCGVEDVGKSFEDLLTDCSNTVHNSNHFTPDITNTFSGVNGAITGGAVARTFACDFGDVYYVSYDVTESSLTHTYLLSAPFDCDGVIDVGSLAPTSPSDPTDPLSIVYDPPTGRVYAAHLLSSYTFRAATLVRDDLYPDEDFVVQWRLKDDVGAPVASSPSLPWIVTDSFLCILPGVCDAFYPTASFTISYEFENGTTYTVEARSRALSGGDWGAWSAPVLLSTEYSCDNPADWWHGILCFFEDSGERLVMPSSASLAYLTTAQDEVAASPMGLFIADGLGYTESDTAYCPMPTFEVSWFDVSGLGTAPEYDLCDAMEDASAVLVADDRVVDGFLAYVAAVGIGLGLGWLGIIVEGKKLT